MVKAAVAGLGSYVPERVMTNLEWTRHVETTDEWIRAKTGISERRIAAPDQCTSDLAAKASLEAMKDAKVKPQDVDLIILATSSPDVPLSSTAAILQGKLGAANAAAFDVAAVCSGWVHGLDIGSRYALDPNYRNVLVVGAEVYSRILNWRDRTSCVFFGDGAGAAVLRRARGDRGVLGTWLRADGRGAGVIQVPAGGTRQPLTHELLDQGRQLFYMDGRAVWDFAVEAFPQAVRGVLDRCGYGLGDVGLIVPHQANINIIATSMERLGLPMEKAYTNIHRYGNMAGASIPVALHEAAKEGRVKKGELVVTVGYGGGLAWGANLIRM